MSQSTGAESSEFKSRDIVTPDHPMHTLTLAHQRIAWRKGDRPRVEDYLSDRPEMRADSEAVLELICNEVILRQEAGDSPLLEEYVLRFPHLTSDLQALFDVESALNP